VAAADGEGRGGAERDVVEAERHPGGYRAARSVRRRRRQAAAAPPPPRDRDWDVGGGGGGGNWQRARAKQTAGGARRDGWGGVHPCERSPPQIWVFTGGATPRLLRERDATRHGGPYI
jgi:hypothetical protein